MHFPDLNSRNKPTRRELQPITNQIQKRTEPAFIEPMQCKSVTALPAGEKWTFEIKFDGYRCIAVKRGREVTLFSRHKKALNRRFRSVVEVLASLAGDFALDENLSPWIHKVGLHSNFCKTVFRNRSRSCRSQR